MKKAAAFAFITLIFLITAPAPAQEPENYCDDKESWAEWADLVAKYPNDEDVQTPRPLLLKAIKKEPDLRNRLTMQIAALPQENLQKTAKFLDALF